MSCQDAIRTELEHITAARELRWLEEGGHLRMFLSEDLATQLGTFALLPQIVSAVDFPVIAASGIADA